MAPRMEGPEYGVLIHIFRLCAQITPPLPMSVSLIYRVIKEYGWAEVSEVAGSISEEVYST